MPSFQATPIPEFQKTFLSIQLLRDFRAALSYVSFYSTDSPFVVQAVQKLHKGFLRLLQSANPLIFHLHQGGLRVNDLGFSELGELLKLFQDKNIPGVRVEKGLTSQELAAWLKEITLPFTEQKTGTENESGFPHIHLLSKNDVVEIGAGSAESVPEIPEVPFAESKPAEVASTTALPPFSLKELGITGKTSVTPLAPHLPDSLAPSNEALLGFVAEAWQYSQAQKRAIGASPEMAGLVLSFDKLFDRLLDRMENTSSEFKHIYQWFRTPPGELLENQVVFAMYPLLEISVKNGWTSVLFDPSTEGLVNDCIAHWGANGKHELVEKTVTCLAEGLSGDILERDLALTHLRDARPWARNAELLQKVLERLNTLLANETYPSLYQTALLLAWDLMEPAMACGNDQPVLTLLSTLHFHADEDVEAFPERSHIARHWLFERSTPELIRRFVYCAHKAGQLHHYPLLGEMAASLLLEDFFLAPAPEKAAYFQLFAEIKEPIRSALAEWLADIQADEEVKLMIPILRICGMDPALSLQLSSWLSKGGRELKLNLIGLIEEVGDPAGGPALRLAVFDDSEEIAAQAARVIGKIGFTPGLAVLLKAAKIREGRFENNDLFLTSVCQTLGDLGKVEALPFLQDIARKKPLLRGKTLSTPVRLEAVKALIKLNQPEVWHFVGTLMEEKNPALQEVLDQIIHEKVQSLS